MLKRREFMIAGSTAVLTSCIPKIRYERQPNIIVIVADDLRWNALGCMGDSIIKTPNIDALSKAGTTFKNHFVTTSICADSRASIFTGLWKTVHQTDFLHPMRQALFQKSYPVILRKNGYFSGFVGKFGMDIAGFTNQLPTDFFDVFSGFLGQGSYYQDNVFGKGEHLTDTITHQAEAFIRQATQKAAPFLLSVSYKAPHVQDELPIGAQQFMYQVRFGNLYQNEQLLKTPEQANNDYHQLPPELQKSLGRTRYIGKLDTPENYSESLKNYYRLISGIDESIGKINQLLKELKIDDSTIIIFTSDNGMMFGEHGLAEKWCMYEASIRTPLIIYDPRQVYFLAGQHISEITLNVDIFPTILSLAKVQAGNLAQGLDLSQVASKNKKRDFFFYIHDLVHPQIPKTVGIRTSRFKYFQLPNSKSRYEALFDLSNDPHEFSNLINQPNYRTTLSELRQQMQQEWARLAAHP